MGLYNGEKAIVHLCGCHDLHTTDGEFMLKRQAKAFVVFRAPIGIRLNLGHYIKGSHRDPFRSTLLKLLIPQTYTGRLNNTPKSTSLKVLHLYERVYSDWTHQHRSTASLLYKN